MNKKILIPVLISGVLLTGLSFTKAFKAAYSDDVIYFDNDKIQALSHSDGITVNFLNPDMDNYWNSDASDVNNLKNLYELNSEIESFASNAFDHEYIRNLYAKWDGFKPVNNTLTWRSNVDASSFDVIVSLNAELTETIYEAKGLTKTEYTMVNPYANTHYFWQVIAHTNSGDVKSSIFDFYSADSKRTVDIPSLSNTRDVGGFTSKYGTTKQGLIYRSARLDDMTKDNREVLRNLEIQTDLDLRNNGEGLKNPANLPNYYLRTLQLYTTNFAEEYRPAMIDAVRVFANPNNYPVLFHCSVGRDRTGTLAIILQALLGASREYIIHDYYSSMWSVTGAYPKSLDGLNLQIVNATLDALEGYGDSLSTGAENYLKQREDTITHEIVGLSDDEIMAIRDIWCGKTYVEHAPKTFKASENYEGKAFVKIEAIGHKDVSLMVNKGSKINAPYELDDGLSWFANNETFDFNNPINETTYIYADYAMKYIVTIHFVGTIKEDEILRLNYGETISLNKYAIDGFDMIILSDEGKELTDFTVTRDAYINIIYFKK